MIGFFMAIGLLWLWTEWLEADSQWAINTRYRIAVTVDPGAGKRHLTPVGIEVDFAKILGENGVNARLDRGSIRVVRYQTDTGHRLRDEACGDVPYQLSRDFYYGDAGVVWWRMRDETDTRFQVYFDTLENGRWAPPERIGLIGVADTLLFNNGEPGPLDVGMCASVRYVDWDGDGLKDLLVSSSHTHEYNVQPGRPSRGFIYFFRNTGEKDASGDPIFAAGYQLRDEEGKYIDNGHTHMRFELVDWDGDGLLDIMTARSGQFFFYQNTGRRDRDGLPILRKRPDASFTLRHGNEVTDDYFHGFFRFVDWNGNGELDIVYAIQRQHVDPDSSAEEEVRYWNEVLEMFEVHINQGRDENGMAHFARPAIIKTARDIPLTSFGYGGGDVADWDGDGRPDLIVSTMQNDPPGGSRIVWFQNTGKPGDPKLMLDIPIVERDEDLGIDPNPVAVDWTGDGHLDLLLAGWEGWIKIYENIGRNASGMPELAPGRFLLQTEPKITGGKQTRSAVEDWNGNGRLDVIQGSGNGWVKFYENIGDEAEPVFRPGVKLQAAGKDIRMINGARDCPQGPSEPNDGYTVPVVIDLDADGDLDLIVGDMRGYQTYFENIGTRTEPKLAAGRVMTVDGEKRVFGWRNQLAVGDIIGDGRVEIVSTGYTNRHVHVYRVAAEQDEPGQLKLVRGEGLLLDSGEVILPDQGDKNNNGDYMMKLADWDNDGDLDLFIGSLYHVWYYENIGSPQAPLFKARGKIHLEGRPMHLSSHAGSVDVVDFNGDGMKDLIIAGESGWTYFVARSFLEGKLPVATAGPLQARPSRGARNR